MPQPSLTDPTDREVATGPSPRLVVAILCLGGLTTSLVQTLVIPIQAELPTLLDTSRSNAAWVITATLLAGAVTMPVAGRLADIFGKQRVLVISGLVLVLGSIVSALADSLTPMLIGRVLQGMAMGYVPVAISLVREVTPPRMNALAIAAISATMGVGGSLAIPSAAWVAESRDYHWIFWFTAALAVVTVLCTWFLVPHVHDAHPARLDLVGMVGLALGLGGLLVGVSKGNDWGWVEPTTWGCIVGGVLVLVAWGVHQVRHADPLVDLRTTARRPVLMTNIAGLMIGFGMMASSIVVPQILALPAETGYGMGQSLLHAGLWMAPGGLVMLAMAPVSSRLINSIGAQYTLAIGGGVLGVAYLLATFLMAEPWQMMLSMMISSAGVGIGFAAMPTLILNNVPMAEAGASVGLNGLMRSVGTTVAGAVMATVLTREMSIFAGLPIPSETAFKICFVIGAVVAFAGALVALALPRRPAAEVAPAPVEQAA